MLVDLVVVLVCRVLQETLEQETPHFSPPQGNAGGTSLDVGSIAVTVTVVEEEPGAVGGNATSPGNGGTGGAGVQVAIAGPAADTTGVGAVNPGPAKVSGLRVVAGN